MQGYFKQYFLVQQQNVAMNHVLCTITDQTKLVWNAGGNESNIYKKNQSGRGRRW